MNPLILRVAGCLSAIGVIALSQLPIFRGTPAESALVHAGVLLFGGVVIQRPGDASLANAAKVTAEVLRSEYPAALSIRPPSPPADGRRP